MAPASILKRKHSQVDDFEDYEEPSSCSPTFRCAKKRKGVSWSALDEVRLYIIGEPPSPYLEKPCAPATSMFIRSPAASSPCLKLRLKLGGKVVSAPRSYGNDSDSEDDSEELSLAAHRSSGSSRSSNSYGGAFVDDNEDSPERNHVGANEDDEEEEDDESVHSLDSEEDIDIAMDDLDRLSDEDEDSRGFAVSVDRDDLEDSDHDEEEEEEEEDEEDGNNDDGEEDEDAIDHFAHERGEDVDELQVMHGHDLADRYNDEDDDASSVSSASEEPLHQDGEFTSHEQHDHHRDEAQELLHNGDYHQHQAVDAHYSACYHDRDVASSSIDCDHLREHEDEHTEQHDQDAQEEPQREEDALPHHHHEHQDFGGVLFETITSLPALGSFHDDLDAFSGEEDEQQHASSGNNTVEVILDANGGAQVFFSPSDALELEQGTILATAVLPSSLAADVSQEECENQVPVAPLSCSSEASDSLLVPLYGAAQYELPKSVSASALVEIRIEGSVGAQAATSNDLSSLDAVLSPVHALGKPDTMVAATAMSLSVSTDEAHHLKASASLSPNAASPDGTSLVPDSEDLEFQLSPDALR